MKTVIVTVKCFLCDFKAEREVEVNESGYFEIGEAYCPNDYSPLDQIIDGKAKEL